MSVCVPTQGSRTYVELSVHGVEIPASCACFLIRLSGSNRLPRDSTASSP